MDLCRDRWLALTCVACLALLIVGTRSSQGWAQEPLAAACLPAFADAPPVPVALAGPAPCDRPLSINLPTALRLAQVRPLDIALASELIRVEAAKLEQAGVLWLPTVYLGMDYARHDGQLQDVTGNVFGTSKQSLMFGAGPSAVFAVTDALFAPLAQRQQVRAQQASLQTACNDTLLAVAEAYFSVQQARGQLAGAEDVVHRFEDLLQRTEKLAPGLIPGLEVIRARTALANARQAVPTARERWRLASADLARLLRLDPGALVEPLEPPHLQVTLIPLERPVDDLILLALTNRPELAAQQTLVQATVLRLRQERLRPLIPSVLIRGFSTPVTGTLAAGVFGGGINSNLSNFSMRSDWDIQLLWEFKNLGFGNLGLVKQRRAENQVALLQLFRLEDTIAAEVARAYAQAQSAAARLTETDGEIKEAVDSAQKNLDGVSKTTVGPNQLIVQVVRPQEAVAAVQSLAAAVNNYYTAVADYDRAQFRLYRALGHPAQELTGAVSRCAEAPPAQALSQVASPSAATPTRPDWPPAVPATPFQAASASPVSLSPAPRVLVLSVPTDVLAEQSVSPAPARPVVVLGSPQ